MVRKIAFWTRESCGGTAFGGTATGGGGLEQHVRGEVQAGDQVSNHGEAQVAAAGQDFGDLGRAAEVGNEILGLEFLLLHAETNRGDRSGKTDGKFFLFVELDERGEDFRFITLGRARHGVEDGVEPDERGLMVGLGLDGLDVHGR